MCRHYWADAAMTQMTERFIITVVAHIDHGKTSLIDSLLAGVNAIPASVAGQLRFMDTREDELIRGITLKLSSTKLIYNKTCFYVIDTPGHVDFEALVQTSAVLADYAALIVDVNEGITPRLFSIVSHIRDKHCVLILNKIDKLFDTSEDVSNDLQHIICQINGLFKCDKFSWIENNVILACALQCSGVNYQKMCKLMKNDPKRTNLRAAVKFWEYLTEKIKTKNTKDIINRFKIKCITEKDIWMGVLPLAESFYDSFLEIKKTLCLKNTHHNSPAFSIQKAHLHDDSTQKELREKHSSGIERPYPQNSNTTSSKEINLLLNTVQSGKKDSCVNLLKTESDYAKTTCSEGNKSLCSLMNNNRLENVCPNGSFIESNPIDIYNEEFTVENGQKPTSNRFRHSRSFDQEELSQKTLKDMHNTYSCEKTAFQSPEKPQISEKITFSPSDTLTEFSQGFYERPVSATNQPSIKKNLKNNPMVHAIVGFSILRRKNCFSLDNILFVVKITQGIINKGDVLVNLGPKGIKYIEIKEIYDLVSANFIEKHFACAGELIYIKGDLCKSSYLTNFHEYQYNWPQQIKPFYKSWIALKNECYQSLMKESLKLLSFLESTFSARINQYNEFEIMCEGKVQFEKICTDLKHMGNDFEILNFKESWAETVTTEHSVEIAHEDYNISMRISPIERNYISEGLHFCSLQKSDLKPINTIDDPDKTSIQRKKRHDNSILEISKLHLDDQSSQTSFKDSNSYIQSNGDHTCQADALTKNISLVHENSSNNRILNCKKITHFQEEELYDNSRIIESTNKCHISLSNIQNEKISRHGMHDEFKENISHIHSNRFLNTVKDAYNTFIDSGPLTESSVKFTQLQLTLEIKGDIDAQDVFNIIKEQLFCLFSKCNPHLMPYYYRCRIQLLADYIGIIYQLLNRYKHKFESETYDTATDFHIIVTLIPQFLYYTFLDEARKLSSGTVYIEIEEYGFERSAQFSDHIIRVRKIRGLEVDEVLVENPDKQRTLKK